MDESDKIEFAELTRKIADDVVQKATGILDPTMRCTYVAQRLERFHERTVVEVLSRIIKGATRHERKFLEFLEDGLDPKKLKEEMGKFKFSRLYHYANSNGFPEVVSMFSSVAPSRISEGEEDLFLVYGLADKTLGERRFLARSTDKITLDKVGYDQNPMVIQELLKNPKITEIDVVKITARRPNLADVLQEIYKNKKWLSRYVIKLSLVSNPYTPPRITLSLLPFMLISDLRNIKEDATLAPEVRTEAQHIFQVKVEKIEKIKA